MRLECSSCQSVALAPDNAAGTLFCPVCGADMDVEGRAGLRPIHYVAGLLLVVLCTTALAIGYVRMSTARRGTVTADNFTVHFSGGVTRDEAARFTRHLKQVGLTATEQITLLLTKEGSTYQLRWHVKDEFRDSTLLAAKLAEAAKNLSAEVLGGAPCEIHICDRDFRTIRVCAP